MAALIGRATFRAWGAAEDAPANASGAAAAPFGLDFREGQGGAVTSTVKSHYDSLSADRISKTEWQIPAGVIPKDGRNAAGCLTRSSWDKPDWKSLQSNYMVHNDSEQLARYHRKFLKNAHISLSDREKRWVKCFRQWHGADEARTLVASTDFSMLPAGWEGGKQIPSGALPAPKRTGQAYREAMEKKDNEDQARARNNRAAAAEIGPLIASVLEQDGASHAAFVQRSPTPAAGGRKTPNSARGGRPSSSASCSVGMSPNSARGSKVGSNRRPGSQASCGGSTRSGGTEEVAQRRAELPGMKEPAVRIKADETVTMLNGPWTSPRDNLNARYAPSSAGASSPRSKCSASSGGRSVERRLKNGDAHKKIGRPPFSDISSVAS